VIVMATFSGVPSFTMSRTAVRRKSCRSIPGQPARLHAVAQAFRESRRRSPFRYRRFPVFGLMGPSV
jgi:hypothetical protein